MSAATPENPGEAASPSLPTSDLRLAENLAELFELERIDADLFRATNEKTSPFWASLYGGQVAGQALRAAALTVPEGRFPHSLHGYFLRPGRWQHPVILEVDRDRDGRTFSARHVSAIQEGQVIFSALASFQAPEEGPEYASGLPAWADPEHLPEERETVSRFTPMLRIRPFQPARPYGPGEFPVPARLWARSSTGLPDDPLLHACVLTYLSDLGSGFADGEVAGLPRGGPSLDHAIWFHHRARADDWMLLWMWPLKAGAARGLYTGTVHDRAGRLLAVLNQEIIFRQPRPTGPGAGA